MEIHGLRSPYEVIGGIVYFGRMVDKIRLQAAEIWNAFMQKRGWRDETSGRPSASRR